MHVALTGKGVPQCLTWLFIAAWFYFFSPLIFLSISQTTLPAMKQPPPLHSYDHPILQRRWVNASLCTSYHPQHQSQRFFSLALPVEETDFPNIVKVKLDLIKGYPSEHCCTERVTVVFDGPQLAAGTLHPSNSTSQCVVYVYLVKSGIYQIKFLQELIYWRRYTQHRIPIGTTPIATPQEICRGSISFSKGYWLKTAQPTYAIPANRSLTPLDAIRWMPYECRLPEYQNKSQLSVLSPCFQNKHIHFIGDSVPDYVMKALVEIDIELQLTIGIDRCLEGHYNSPESCEALHAKPAEMWVIGVGLWQLKFCIDDAAYRQHLQEMIPCLDRMNSLGTKIVWLVTNPAREGNMFRPLDDFVMLNHMVREVFQNVSYIHFLDNYEMALPLSEGHVPDAKHYHGKGTMETVASILLHSLCDS